MPNLRFDKEHIAARTLEPRLVHREGRGAARGQIKLICECGVWRSIFFGT